MFGAETVTKGLSFTKVLSGLNKTLTIANQVIPIYRQAKPMIQNAKSAFQLLKTFNAPQEKKSIATSKEVKAIPQKKTSQPIVSSSSNSPSFFL